MREWKHRHDFAGVENAGVEKSARFCRGGKGGSGKIGTILQGWKMREWKHRERSILMQNVEKRMVRLIRSEIIFEEFQRISSQSTNVTNRRTDRRTSYHGNTALCYASNGSIVVENCHFCFLRSLYLSECYSRPKLLCLSMYSPQMAFRRHRTDDQMTLKNHFALNTVF